MAITDTKKDLLLGSSIDTIVQNADDNFVSLFDTVDDLHDSITNGGYLTKDVNNLTNYTVKTETGTDIELSVDSNYVMTLKLKNIDGTVVSTDTVDLPIESLVMNASYAGGKLTLTLQNGNTVDVDISSLISGLVPDSRKVNNKTLKSDITLTQDDIGNGSTYVRTENNYTDSEKSKLASIDSSLQGVTADEIGKVKDVKVNGTSVLGSDGTAAITLEELQSGYVTIETSDARWTTKTVNGATYQAIKVEKTDTAIEVYNYNRQKIITQPVFDSDYLYICVGTAKISCTLRTIGGFGDIKCDWTEGTTIPTDGIYQVKVTTVTNTLHHHHLFEMICYKYRSGFGVITHNSCSSVVFHYLSTVSQYQRFFMECNNGTLKLRQVGQDGTTITDITDSSTIYFRKIGEV